MCTVGVKERYVNVLQDAVFQRFFEQAEIANFTPEEQYDYRESQKDYWDLFSVVETAEQKGIIKGIEIEREQQLKKQEEERISNINRMRSKGYDDTTIADLLDLPLDYIQQH